MNGKNEVAGGRKTIRRVLVWVTVFTIGSAQRGVAFWPGVNGSH